MQAFFIDTESIINLKLEEVISLPLAFPNSNTIIFNAKNTQSGIKLYGYFSFAKALRPAKNEIIAE